MEEFARLAANASKADSVRGLGGAPGVAFLLSSQEEVSLALGTLSLPVKEDASLAVLDVTESALKSIIRNVSENVVSFVPWVFEIVTILDTGLLHDLKRSRNLLHKVRQHLATLSSTVSARWVVNSTWLALNALRRGKLEVPSAPVAVLISTRLANWAFVVVSVIKVPVTGQAKPLLLVVFVNDSRRAQVAVAI